MRSDNIKSSSFEEQMQKLDFGSGHPTSVETEVIDVKINPDTMIGNFCEQWVNQSDIREPLRSEKLGLEPEELKEYIHFVLYQRILMVQGKAKQVGRLKNLYMPEFIAYVLHQIGRVDLRQYGLQLMPQMDEPEMTFEQAMEVSSKVEAAQSWMKVTHATYPYDRTGDPDLMSTALIGSYMRSIMPVEHPVSTYLGAFLGLQLQKETVMSTLYRVQYDDIQFIRSAFMSQDMIF